MTQQQPQQDRLTECHCFTEDEYPYCNDRAMPCRYKDQFSRRKCPDYKSVIHHQVECDVRQGTMFAQQMVSDALGEPIYSRPHPAEPATCPDTCIYKRFAQNMRNAAEHDATIRTEEREWWMLRVKTILQRTKFYDELECELQALIIESGEESLRTLTTNHQEKSP